MLQKYALKLIYYLTKDHEIYYNTIYSILSQIFHSLNKTCLFLYFIEITHQFFLISLKMDIIRQTYFQANLTFYISVVSYKCRVKLKSACTNLGSGWLVISEL